MKESEGKKELNEGKKSRHKSIAVKKQTKKYKARNLEERLLCVSPRFLIFFL